MIDQREFHEVTNGETDPGRPASNSPSKPPQDSDRRVLFWPVAIAWLITFEYVLGSEIGRLHSRLLDDATTGNWWDRPDLDTTLFLPLLAIAPFCWLFSVKSSQIRASSSCESIKRKWPTRRKVALASAACALLALNMCVLTRYREWTVGTVTHVLADETPVVHDEFSYLLQARTLLAGRWGWTPPEQCPDLFQPMHVLCDDVYASRYFPGTGMRLAPWVAMGVPIVGLWAAAMFVSVGMVLVGMQAADLRTGILAGVLTAVAPGIDLFSNLFLSHLPTLVGITVFLYGMIRWMQDPRRWALWLAGTGLSFAMLCRPLTAAAIGLPFGVWYVLRGARAFQVSGVDRQNWLRGLPGLGVPLLLGFVVLGWQNLSVTGDLFLTPYSQFNRIHTPRHVYGFGNGSQTSIEPERGFHDYNNWAKNLDSALAIQNVNKRFWAGWQWSLGIVPMMMASIAFLLNWRRWSLGLRLSSLSIICLHAAYVPYWLDGMLSHHYVFEAGLLWIVILAAGFSSVITESWREGRLLFPVWCVALLAVSVLQNHVAIGSPATPSRLETGIDHTTPAAAIYQRFRQTLTEIDQTRPVLIVVQPSLGDLHVEYVRQFPPFDEDLLIGVNRHAQRSIDEIVECFPDRTV